MNNYYPITWLDVIGFESLYEVSDTGLVKSMRRNTTKGKVLSPGIVRGYEQVALSKDGRSHQRKVHRLVLDAFVGLSQDGMECRHLDGNKQNNHIDNLCWGTRSENYQDKIQHGTDNGGERNGRAKLTEEDVKWILQLAPASRKIAKCFGVSPSLIQQIRRRDCWEHV